MTKGRYTGSHEVRGSIPLGSTKYTRRWTLSNAFFIGVLGHFGVIGGGGAVMGLSSVLGDERARKGIV
jgi:hypothetical protein